MEEIDIRSTKNNFGDIVYQQILKQFLAHELKPGDRIQIDDLAKSLGISPTPVKHALARLAGEGLVVFKAGLGPFVAAPTLLEIQQMYDACLMCEVHSISQGMDNVNATFLSDLHYLVNSYESAVNAMDGTRERNNVQVAIDRNFHERIAGLSPNPTILTWYGRLNIQLRAFMQAPSLCYKREEAAAEHNAILDALVRHDPAATIEAIRHHTKAATSFLLEYATKAGLR